jgi:putative ABC transport system ATP-binding protein
MSANNKSRFAGAHAIEIREVTKTYGQGARRLEILSKISLDIPDNCSVSLMGRSGGGKSTLISLLAGLDQAEIGSVKVFGEDLNLMKPHDINQFRAQNIGIIFQQFHLLDHLTALENVRLPLDLDAAKDSQGRAMNWLARVGLAERAEHFPDQMSRGECQRIAIARGLIRSPRLLLADEPTGSLDLASGESVMNLILSLQKTEKFVLFLVTHDEVHAQKCEIQYRLQDGKMLRKNEISK